MKERIKKSLMKSNNKVEKEEERGKGKGKESEEMEGTRGNEMKVTENVMEEIRRNGSKEENDEESKRRNKMGETCDDNDDSNDDDDKDNYDDGNNDEKFEYFNYHSLWLSNVRVQCLLMTSFSTSTAQECYLKKGNEECYLQKGNEECYLQKGNKECYLQKGNEECYLQKGNKECYLQKGNKEMDPVTGRDKQEEIMRNEIINNKAGDKKHEEDKKVGIEVEKEVEADWTEALDGTFKHRILNCKICSFFVLLLKSKKTFYCNQTFFHFFLYSKKDFECFKYFE